MKKGIVIILSSAILLILALNHKETSIFKNNNVYKIEKELTSGKYAGRLAGQNGNVLAAKFIGDYFKSIGLKPLLKNKSYYQSFKVYVPVYYGKYKFDIIDKKGNRIKSYTYGRDYKEVIYGNIEAENIEGRAKINIKNNGNILLINNGEAEETPSAYMEDIKLKKNNIAALIYKTNDILRFKAPYKLQISCIDGLLKIKVPPKVFMELCRYSLKGYTFKISSPTKIMKVQASNVIGLLEGKNKSLPPLILSFHFDHVGRDYDGMLYPGALDNASGTAFVMECARVLKAYSRNRDIIIAGFNAEEEGLIGSRYFVLNDFEFIRNSLCINFDMVGSKSPIPLTMMTSTSNKDNIKKLKNLINDPTIKIAFNDSSDHSSFNSFGINAVTFINDDENKIHTPMDDMNNVNSNSYIKIFNKLIPILKAEGIKK